MKFNICVIGLGYVGLPLATRFASKGFNTSGFDIKKSKVQKLKKGLDDEKILTKSEIKNLKKVKFLSNLPRNGFSKATIYIVTVPTPINSNKLPDMEPLLNASSMIGKYVNKGDIVVYESTVYPGATEETCIPRILESSVKRGIKKINYGYSPERINPGDRNNTLEKIIKVVSGNNKKTTNILSQVYGEIIDAGIHVTETVREAEATKIIENIQRDLNIALMNELDQIFYCENIKTTNVIEAAATKWNFMNVKPGLVGGHCIGVDPYYMIFKSRSLGIEPNLINGARVVNEGYLDHIYLRTIEKIFLKNTKLNNKKILFWGYTFKPDCNDIRNSKALELFSKLKKVIPHIEKFDPLIDKSTPEDVKIILVCTQHENYMNKILEQFPKINKENIILCME